MNEADKKPYNYFIGTKRQNGGVWQATLEYSDYTDIGGNNAKWFTVTRHVRLHALSFSNAVTVIKRDMADTRLHDGKPACVSITSLHLVGSILQS